MISVNEMLGIILIEYKGEKISDCEQREALNNVSKLIRKNKKPISIISDTGDTNLTSVQRKISAEWFNENSDIVPLIKSVAIVIHSSIQRGIVTAIMWLAPNISVKNKIFGDVDSAIKWSKSM